MTQAKEHEAETSITPYEAAEEFGIMTYLTPDERAMLSGEGDPDAQARAILARVLMAETPDEAFGDEEVTGGLAFIGQPLQVVGFTLNLSDYAGQGGAPVYAVVDVKPINPETGETGSPVKITCGGVRVLGGLLRARQQGWLPITVTIERANKPTKRGFYPLRLVLA